MPETDKWEWPKKIFHDQSPLKNVARPGRDQTLDLITDWATEASLDNYAAQNKNRYIFSMFWYAIQVCLESIEKKKYLEKGQTQNENNSVHAFID